MVSLRHPYSTVIPAQAGIQGNRAMTFVALDPRLRGDDDQNRKAGQAC